MGTFDFGDMQKKVIREQKTMQRSVAKEQRAIQKGVAKDLGYSISKEGRVRVDAKTREKVNEKCRNKCHYPRCSITLKSGLLEVHHINMKNNDNRVKNLELLCPTHHSLKHKKAFRRKTTTYDIIKGTQTRSRLVKKKLKMHKKMHKRKSNKRKPVFDPLNFKAPKSPFL